MTDRLAHSSRPGATIDWTRPGPQMAAFGLLFLVAAVFNNALGWLNTDTSWLILVAHRMLDGERLYVDVWDTNPPFSVLLYLPMAWLERLTGLRAETWTSLALFAALAVSLWLSAAILRRTVSMGQPARVALLLALAAIILLAMPREFAQREHFGIVLALPLLLIYALHHKTAAPLPVWMSLLAGALGAVLLIVKPHYALGYALAAGYLLLRDRNWRLLLNPAHFAGAGVVMLYAASIFAFFPAFLSDVLPLVSEFYLPRRLPTGELFSLSLSVLGPALVLLALMRLKAGDPPRAAAVLMLAGLGFWLAFWWNGKGWAYHFWPSLVALYIAALVWLAPQQPTMRSATRKLLLFALLACFVLSHYGLRAYPSRDLVVPQQIEVISPAPSMAVIGSDIGVGNPLARRLRAHWRERENADLLAALAWTKLQTATDPDKRAELRGLVEDAVARKAAYIAAWKPDFILLDTRATAVTTFMLADSGLQSELLAYEPIGCSEGVSFLLRSDAAAFGELENWRAAAIEGCG